MRFFDVGEPLAFSNSELLAFGQGVVKPAEEKVWHKAFAWVQAQWRWIQLQCRLQLAKRVSERYSYRQARPTPPMSL